MTKIEVFGAPGTEVRLGGQSYVIDRIESHNGDEAVSGPAVTNAAPSLEQSMEEFNFRRELAKHVRDFFETHTGGDFKRELAEHVRDFFRTHLERATPTEMALLPKLLAEIEGRALPH